MSGAFDDLVRPFIVPPVEREPRPRRTDGLDGLGGRERPPQEGESEPRSSDTSASSETPAQVKTTRPIVRCGDQLQRLSQIVTRHYQ